MQRHDLVHIANAAWVQPCADSLPDMAVAKFFALLGQGLPLTVTRQPSCDDGRICLAMNVLTHQGKYRVACHTPMTNITDISPPLPVMQAASLFDAWSAQQLGELVSRLQACGCAVHVYGSYAYQLLTGEPYVTPLSDVDLLFVLDDWRQLSAVMMQIADFRAVFERRIDGEMSVRLPDVAEVVQFSFNEYLTLTTNPACAQIIIKSLHDVRLYHAAGLLGLAQDTPPKSSLALSQGETS
ncbi:MULTISPECIES: malonate decarboxylase holo-[acyl-carrier-protein] synthase [Moraxella]|uniref:Phosphoribosyl-dephospho-CoA transferase n=1 Tax=Moraxella catarrhalis TaxID=480 RepID=A0A7Z0UZK7_MORCA|nr:malonate decarboxylase holo-[acyl-carrier-protein] synthase [Moraxella catarrhalis]OAV01594.1 Phosphoribosyl-dephospho-CoA transferase [Moraxella catarrhalis]STY82673.1 phosphoribosyl-dephospho-CoA transferase [Moraxella catarrhalis]